MAKIKPLLKSTPVRIFILLLVLSTCLAAAYYATRTRPRTVRISRIGEWFSNQQAHADWQITGNQRCGDAPMLMPSTGFIGVGWRDGAPPMYQHTGFDIFSPDPADNITPIYAAYDGYLTREEHWRSAVIIRHPDDPVLSDLTGGEQIWTYYTHMASKDGSESFISPEFPRGIRDKFVEAGTLLGYQGSWSGDPNRNMGRHLHFSIARSNADGSYTNETQIENTLDPTPFLGLTMTEDGFLLCLQDEGLGK